LKYAQECKARRVVSIHLQVGELRDVVEEWVQRYFDYLSEGTIAEGSKLVFKRTPASSNAAIAAALTRLM